MFKLWRCAGARRRSGAPGQPLSHFRRLGALPLPAGSLELATTAEFASCCSGRRSAAILPGARPHHLHCPRPTTITRRTTVLRPSHPPRTLRSRRPASHLTAPKSIEYKYQEVRIDCKRQQSPFPESAPRARLDPSLDHIVPAPGSECTWAGTSALVWSRRTWTWPRRGICNRHVSNRRT